MSRSSIFPYGITFKQGGKVDVFPAAEVWFSNKKKEQFALMFLVDSGASISVLPQSDFFYFDVEPSEGVPVQVGGIGGQPLFGRQLQLAANIGGLVIKIPVVFVDDDFVPRVLGREGVFNRFTVIFEEEKHRSAFFASKSRAAASVRKILDSV